MKHLLAGTAIAVTLAFLGGMLLGARLTSQQPKPYEQRMIKPAKKVMT